MIINQVISSGSKNVDLIVTVKNSSSVAISGATVIASYSGGSNITGTTDSSGVCSLKVPPGYDYTVTSSATGYFTDSVTAHVDAGGVSLTVAIGAKPIVTVNRTGASGSITVSGGTYTVSGTTYTLDSANTTYTFSVAEVSGYFTPSSQTVNLTANGTQTLTFTYIAKPKIKVTVTGDGKNGLTVSATDGADTVTGTTSSTGIVTLTVNNIGTYTVSIPTPPSGATVSSVTTTVSGGSTSNVTLTLKYVYYWAVNIAANTTDPYTRCTYPQTITVNGQTVNNRAYGFTPMAGSSSGTFTTGSWADEEIVTGIKPVYSTGGSVPVFLDSNKNSSKWTSPMLDYFTEFPFNWVRIDQNQIVFSNADTQPDNRFQCWAFCRACDSYTNGDIAGNDGNTGAMSNVSRDAIMSSNNNEYFANSFHVGCFHGVINSSKLCSRASTQVSISQPISKYCEAANTKGNEYDIMSHQQWMYIQALFILLFKSTSSQASHSHGLAKVGTETLSVDKSNTPLSTDNYGMAGKIGVAERNAFFWIHDPWGNIETYVGGMWFPSGQTYLYYWLPRTANARAFGNGWDATTTASLQRVGNTSSGAIIGYSTNYTNSGSSLSGFISNISTSPFKTGFIGKSTTSGSSTKYWCDEIYLASQNANNAKFIRYGGSCNLTSGYCGIFCVYISSTSISNSDSACARLTYRGGH